MCHGKGGLNETIQYMKERIAFGEPIATLQNTRFKIAQKTTKVRIHRSFIQECMDKFDNRNLDIKAVSMVKYSCNGMQGEVVGYCL